MISKFPWEMTPRIVVLLVLEVASNADDLASKERKVE